MMRLALLAYGLVGYLGFFVAIVWSIGFVANIAVPKSIDSGQPGPIFTAILVNSLMLGAFAIQHTIMARRGFKQWILRYIPEAVERSTFVLAADAILLVTLWQWRPMPEMVWHVQDSKARAVLYAFYGLGWAMVFLASFLINHFDLFGLRQVFIHWQKKEYRPLVFRTTALYKVVRHPLLLGFLIAFWSAPDMSQGRLLFAILTTAYIFVGIQFEERDLAANHGEVYRRYQREVPMILPYRKPLDLGADPVSDASDGRIRA